MVRRVSQFGRNWRDKTQQAWFACRRRVWSTTRAPYEQLQNSENSELLRMSGELTYCFDAYTPQPGIAQSYITAWWSELRPGYAVPSRKLSIGTMLHPKTMYHPHLHTHIRPSTGSIDTKLGIKKLMPRQRLQVAGRALTRSEIACGSRRCRVGVPLSLVEVRWPK